MELLRTSTVLHRFHDSSKVKGYLVDMCSKMTNLMTDRFKNLFVITEFHCLDITEFNIKGNSIENILGVSGLSFLSIRRIVLSADCLLTVRLWSSINFDFLFENIFLQFSQEQRSMWDSIVSLHTIVWCMCR